MFHHSRFKEWVRQNIGERKDIFMILFEFIGSGVMFLFVLYYLEFNNTTNEWIIGFSFALPYIILFLFVYFISKNNKQLRRRIEALEWEVKYGFR